MAESRFKTVGDILTRLNSVPRVQVTDPDTGLVRYADDVVGTSFNRTDMHRVDGLDVQHDLDAFIDMMDRTFKDNEVIDYKLRERASSDYMFLRQTVLDRGSRS